MTQKVSGMYENGKIRFRTTVKLGRKLPLPNHTRLVFKLELPRTSRGTAWESFGLIRVPKRLARLIAESPEFSVLNS